MRARGCRVGFWCRLATLAAVAAVVTPEASAARALQPAGRHHARRHLVGRAAFHPLNLRLPAADDFSDGRGTWRNVAIATPPAPVGRPATAIDYRLAPRGPIGSVGLLRPVDTQAAPPAYLPASAGLRRGYPQVTAGAKLSYPF